MRPAVQPVSFPAPKPARETARKTPLWVAVDFPLLALEVLSIGQRDCAVATEPSRRGALVYQASASARSLGIMPGLSISAALAICTELSLHPRDRAAEQRRLQRFHRWANGFTPAVSLLPPTSILLEVAASLKLFGGIDTLCRHLRDGLDHLGHQYCLAITPTPAASSVLAAAGREVLIMDQAGLRPALGRLPVQSLCLEADINRKLQAMGVTLLCELWRLPRSDLARRLGADIVHRIDRLLGVRPDPRPADSISPEFDRRYELEAETIEVDPILWVTESLLEELVRFLQRADAVAGEIRILLHHAGRSATVIDLATRVPVRSRQQWGKLLWEHMQRHELAAPVTGVQVRVRHFQPGRPDTVDLFGKGHEVREWSCSLDELEARLGKNCLWAPAPAADHRPEYAWGRSGRMCSAPVPDGMRRPLWLFREPRRLRYGDGHIWYAGLLNIIDGPERIESGWWDGREYCRDYYIASSVQGSRLWIFEDLKRQGHWYLHGLFG